jgi:hypothetical protein
MWLGSYLGQGKLRQVHHHHLRLITQLNLENLSKMFTRNVNNRLQSPVASNLNIYIKLYKQDTQ